jgi:tetratricopeptide (TPR) repeat protein
MCVDPVRAAQLRGDLDAILGRALAKVPGERYATVDGFADDLKRHLRGEPVRARPPSPVYRAERWLRRHRVEAAIVAAVLLALLGGAYAQVLVVLALGVAAALWQRNRAREETERARLALARAEQVKQFITSIFSQAVPRNGQGGPVTALDLLQAATQRIESDLIGQPEVAAELGVLIGSSFNALGEVQAGFEWLPRAVALCNRALGPTHPLTLDGRWRLVEAANSIGWLDVAEPMLPALLQDARDARPPRPELLAAVLRSQAFVDTKRGREQEAMAALHEAVEIAAKHFGEASEEALMARSSLSNTYKHFGHHAEALQSIEPALALARAAFGSRRPHDVLHWVERAYADALERNRRPRDAASMLRQVLAGQMLLDAGESSRVRIVISTLAQALVLSGCFEEGDAMWSRAEALLDSPGGLGTDEGVAHAAGRALACVLAGRADDALAHLAHADARRGERSEGQVLTLGREAMRVLAEAMTGHCRDALAGADRLLAGDDIDATVRVRLWRARAVACRLSGDTAAALHAAAQGIRATEVPGSGDLERGLIEAEAARCNLAAGDTAAAAMHFEVATQAWQAGQVDGPALAALRAEQAAARQEPADRGTGAHAEKIRHGMA